MTMHTLEDLFRQELRDVFDAEKRLVKALPKMARSAAHDELREAFSSHLQETKTHVNRLEKAFAELDRAARGKRCAAMEGLIEEGSQMIREEADDAVHDAGLICAAQKVEHYEIAAYGTLVEWAKRLGVCPGTWADDGVDGWAWARLRGGDASGSREP